MQSQLNELIKAMQALQHDVFKLKKRPKQDRAASNDRQSKGSSHGAECNLSLSSSMQDVINVAEQRRDGLSGSIAYSSQHFAYNSCKELEKVEGIPHIQQQLK